MASSASFALAQKEKLEVVYSSIGGTSIPLWIAQDRGFFDRNGLETRLIYIGGGRIVAQAFAAGQIKIAVMAGPGMVSANPRRAESSDDRRAHQYFDLQSFCQAQHHLATRA